MLSASRGGALGLELLGNEAKKLVCKGASKLVRNLSPLPLGEGRILNELASCKNSGEGVTCINPSQPSLKKGRSVVVFLLRDGKFVIQRTHSEESHNKGLVIHRVKHEESHGKEILRSG